MTLMIRTMLGAIAATAMTMTIAAAQQPAPRPSQPPAAPTELPAPRGVECHNFTATDEKGAVQHYEDCTPSDGAVKRCEVIDATDARGKVRHIQNCALVAPANTAK
jgi:hypothetical protein